MSKGYWIAHVEVHDQDAWNEYRSLNKIAFRKYGARFLVRGGSREVAEGQARSSTVVIEFKDYTTAIACLRSPEYAASIEKRRGKGHVDLVIAEGYDGAQPG